jgi:uncharacterized protein YlxP (DUF503 family)
VGFLIVTLLLAENANLKDKRRVVKSVLARVRARFNASCSEIDLQDVRDEARLGFSVCGPDARVLRSVLSRILDFVEDHADAEVVDYDLFCPLAPEELTEAFTGEEDPEDAPRERIQLTPLAPLSPMDPLEERGARALLELALRNGRLDAPEYGDDDDDGYDDELDYDELDDDEEPGEDDLEDDDDGEDDDDPDPPGILKFRPGPRRRDN